MNAHKRRKIAKLERFYSEKVENKLEQKIQDTIVVEQNAAVEEKKEQIEQLSTIEEKPVLKKKKTSLVKDTE